MVKDNHMPIITDAEVCCPKATIPILLAVEWKKGMAVKPDTFVVHGGLTYFNKQQGEPNTGNPATSKGYTKALVGAQLLKFIVEYYST